VRDTYDRLHEAFETQEGVRSNGAEHAVTVE
jgi:hypothetical protein